MFEILKKKSETKIIINKIEKVKKEGKERKKNEQFFGEKKNWNVKNVSISK